VQGGGQVLRGAQRAGEAACVLAGVAEGGADQRGEAGRGPAVVVGDAAGGGLGFQPPAERS
jgi:hypothetical protein